MEEINYFLKISLSIFPVMIFIVCTVAGVKMEKERPVKRTPFYGERFKVKLDIRKLRWVLRGL